MLFFVVIIIFVDERDIFNICEGMEIGGNFKGNILCNSVNVGICGF